MGTRVWGLEAKGMVCRMEQVCRSDDQSLDHYQALSLTLASRGHCVCSWRSPSFQSPVPHSLKLHKSQDISGLTFHSPERRDHKVFPTNLRGGFEKMKHPENWKVSDKMLVFILSVIKTLWHLTLCWPWQFQRSYAKMWKEPVYKLDHSLLWMRS